MACRAEDLPLIRPMHLGDLPAVMALEVQAYPHPWTAGIFADCLRAGYSAWTLRDADDHLVAYALMSLAAGEGHVLNICVAPRWQGRGHGQRLLAHLIHIARHAATEVLCLEVRASNLRAAALYVAAGFKPIGRRPGYYPCPDGQREDADVYALSLAEP